MYLLQVFLKSIKYLVSKKCSQISSYYYLLSIHLVEIHLMEIVHKLLQRFLLKRHLPKWWVNLIEMMITRRTLVYQNKMWREERLQQTKHYKLNKTHCFFFLFIFFTGKIFWFNKNKKQEIYLLTWVFT